MRKLASIVVVDDILPIAKADAIEVARVGGWQCVVKKGAFRAGDRGVYLEIDAVPLDTPSFAWLWQPRTPGAEPVPRPTSFRIRTMRLRGTLSQGLLLPIADVAHLIADATVGDDVSIALGIRKYEPPAPAGSGSYRAPFPSLVPKTDEVRVQALPEVLEELRGKPWVATLKCDGTSATFVMVEGELHCCSRNLSVVDDGTSFYWHLARALKIEEILAGTSLAIQGEIVGPGIQKNPMGLADKSLRVFSVYDVAAARFFADAELRAFCARHSLEPVPIVGGGDAFDETVGSLLEKAEGKYPGTTNEREGIVVRPRDTDEWSEILQGRLSFKAISNRFLLDEA